MFGTFKCTGNAEKNSPMNTRADNKLNIAIADGSDKRTEHQR
jgi:hypothetical protein